MYKIRNMKRGTMTGVIGFRAESIEAKMKRVITSGEPIKDTAPATYTEAKDGVQPDYDIRTDKYEYLVEGHDAVAKTKRAKRDNVAKAQADLDAKNAELKGEGPKKTD